MSRIVQFIRNGYIINEGDKEVTFKKDATRLYKFIKTSNGSCVPCYFWKKQKHRCGFPDGDNCSYCSKNGVIAVAVKKD